MEAFGSSVSGGLDCQMEAFVYFALSSYSSSDSLGQAEALLGCSESFDFTLIYLILYY